jgi:hypothetical protein
VQWTAEIRMMQEISHRYKDISPNVEPRLLAKMAKQRFSYPDDQRLVLYKAFGVSVLLIDFLS